MQLPSIFDYSEYRSFLKAVLDDKVRKNPTFSLRAFARLCDMSPSHLSRTLQGKKKLSAMSAHQISKALQLNSRETQHFVQLIELEKKNDPSEKSIILKQLSSPGKKARVVPFETFRLIADWYHFALIALTQTKGFQSQPSWIAARLGIRPLEARFAVERLLGLGLLTETPRGLKAVDDAEIRTTEDVTSTAIQENHRQHLEMAQKALHEIATELREFNNMSISVKLNDIPEAKRRIRQFMDSFDEEFKSRSGDEVYQLNLQFYPLSKSEKGRS